MSQANWTTVIGAALTIGRNAACRERWPSLCLVLEDLGLTMGTMVYDVGRALSGPPRPELDQAFERQALLALARACKGEPPPAPEGVKA